MGFITTPLGAHYFQWGWFSVSIGNIATISAVVALLVLALVVPFPKEHDVTPIQREQDQA